MEAIAFLWSDVDTPPPAAPVTTREQLLPFGELTWENFERLCFRVAHRTGEVEDARIYGERGQAQEGIDLYVRRASGDYATWQCKRYREITTTDIEDAVSIFLGGTWASRTKVFQLAVASGLNATGLAEEIERQRARCASVDITFEPLDRERLSLILKEHPDLVDDFFGRSWVEAFNGPQAAATLSGRKLSNQQSIEARRLLLTLYDTHFHTIDGGIPAAAPLFRGAIKRVAVFDRYVEPTIELVDSILEPEQIAVTERTTKTETIHNKPPAAGFRRREVQTKLLLSAGLATSERLLLLGNAGFGKSAALRVVIHSLLSGDTRFPELAKSWGQRLPLLLPFGFLTRHFAENDAATIEDALKSWLRVLGAKSHILTLLEEIIADERLLLLVDGLDEWQNRESAVSALTALTAYAQTRRLPLVATGRPLGFERISDFGPDWKRANLLPLTAAQQRAFATYWFRHFHNAGATFDAVALEQAVARDATEFANELSEDTALAELGGIPLLLSVMIYLRLSGRVIPNSRLAAIEELVKALLEDQPRRRAQAAMQGTDLSIARSPRIRRGLEYLAYRIHQEPNSLTLSNDRAAQLLSHYFRSELELPSNEADEWANRVLELGQHEFGVLVAPQEQYVGLAHRIFQEFLAAKYLARLSLAQVRQYCTDSGRKGPWHEVTITLMQLLERQDDVDELVEQLRSPVPDCLDEPLQQILLARLAVAEISFSRSKAHELVAQVFSWIELGRWMPLRLSLVREIAAGLESEHVGALVMSRMQRWFPGRTLWLHGGPSAAVALPWKETVNDLRVALHNCESSYEYRQVAEALAACASSTPTLSDEFLSILKGPSEPALLSAALHALATGWPTHPILPALLTAASTSPAKELRYVAALAMYNQGTRTVALRDALVSFCREFEWPWPWEDDIMSALVAGWPRDPELRRNALQRINGIGVPGSWAPNPAIKYLLLGCPGDDEVARMLSRQLSLNRSDRNFTISDVSDALLAGFTRHPLLISTAEEWIKKNPLAHDPIEASVMARIGGTPICRKFLLDWLRRGQNFPAWILSAIVELSEVDDQEVREVFSEYIRDERRRMGVVQWLPYFIHNKDELETMLQSIARDAHVFDSCAALEMLITRDERWKADLWPMVENRITNDASGSYWRLGNHVLLKFWSEQPRIRQLTLSTIYSEDTSLSALYKSYGNDVEIRPLLDQTLQVLHEDLRHELIRAVEPMARRGVLKAISVVESFRDEPNGEVRTLSARAYSRACIRLGSPTEALKAGLISDLNDYLGREPQQQAAIAALLELDQPDLIAAQLNNGRPSELSTYANSRRNWEFIAALVEHWEDFAGALPNAWDRFRHSPILATELTKAGKGRFAHDQTTVFEEAIRTGVQVQLEHVQALIALHGRSTLLRDLFISRLQHFVTNKDQSMMAVERSAYNAMATYISDYYHDDVAAGQAMVSVAGFGLIRDVGLIALCRGWPDSDAVANATSNLADRIEGYEPLTAWLFSSKADAVLMASYLKRYPGKLKEDRFGDGRAGITAIRGRLQADQECRVLVFDSIRTISDPDTRVTLIKLLALSMRSDEAFRSWISDQVFQTRDGGPILCQLAFDALSNAVKPVEFALREAALTRY